MPRTRASPPEAERQTPATGGWACVYPGKIRQTLTFTLTEEGHRVLRRRLRERRMSRSDYLEDLVREDGKKNGGPK